MRLKGFLCDGNCICFLAFVKTTYIKHCYIVMIYSQVLQKSLEKMKWHTEKVVFFVF